MIAIAFLIILAFPSMGWPAITCSGTSYPFNTPTDPQAQNHTIPSLTNGIALVHAQVRNGARSVTGTPTVGGVATTRINVRTNATDTVSEAFYLLNPTAGVQSVDVNWDNTPLSYVLTVTTCDGVNQSSPIATDNAATGSGTTISVGCDTTSVNQLVVDFAGADGNAAGLTTGGGQTNIDQDISDATLSAGMSSEPGSGGTITMSHTITSNDWATICAVLNPASTSRSVGVVIFQ